MSSCLFHMESSRSLPVARTKRVMSEWPNRWILQLPETINRGVDTACGCNYHCLRLWFLSVAGDSSWFVMTMQASGLEIVVGGFARPLRGVGVLAMPDTGLDTTRFINSFWEVHPDDGVLGLNVPSITVGVFIDRLCVADWVEVTRSVTSAMQKFLAQLKGRSCDLRL